MLIDPELKDSYYNKNSADALGSNNDPALEKQTMFVIGLLKTSYNDHESAINTYSQLLSRNNNDKEAFFNRGLAYMNLYRYKIGYQRFRKSDFY